MGHEKPSAAYDQVADKVGMVPNVRLKDNLIQLAVVAIATPLGAVVGWLVGRCGMAAFFGAVGGLVAGALLSGLVLMVAGLVRE
jgi:membrane associated rhomboid family serine protease